MLVLSRKVGEKLVIGDNIVIEVIRIKGNRVALGLAAPADVKILRHELSQRDRSSRPAEDELNQAGDSLRQAG